jgi:predicted peptidase
MRREPFSLCHAGLLLVFFLLAPRIATAAELAQDDIDFRKEVYVAKNGDRLPYRLFVPLGYDKHRKYPLVLWLHDSDGRGEDNLKQLAHNNHLAAHFWISKPVQANFPAFVLLPQCPSGKNWSEPELNLPDKSLQLTMDVLTKIETQFPIDPDRIYVGGQSMGGLGVYSLLQKYPGLWAGALILSAYDNFTDANAIARVPLWVFQGEADDSVPVSMVRDMMRALKKANAGLRYTEYPKAGHDIWTKAFAEPDLVSWLSAQHRAASPESQVGSGASSPNR